MTDTMTNGAPDPQSMLAELRAQVEALRQDLAAERAVGEEDERTISKFLADDERHGVEVKALLARAEQAEAGAAAMREAAQVVIDGLDASCEDPYVRGEDTARDVLNAALTTDAGAAMLERVRRAERALEKVNEIRNDIIGRQAIGFSRHVYPLVAALEEAGVRGAGYEKARAHVLQFARLLRAAQSLHRAWRRAEQQVDALRESLTHTGLESAAAIRGRDAAQKALAAAEQQRDEAREALRLLLEEAGDPERQGDRHTGDGLAMSQPCRDAVARILEVEP